MPYGGWLVRVASAYRRSYRFGVGEVVEAEEIEKLADLMAGLGPVAHRHLAVDDVPVAASDPLDRDESRLGQVADDPLRRALGDPDHRGDVAGSDVGVARDAQQRPACGSSGSASPGLSVSLDICDKFVV